MKDLAEDTDQEKALKDVAKVNTKEKVVAAATSEKKPAAVKKAKTAMKKKYSEL